MRNLRERLMAVAASKPVAEKPVQRPQKDPFYLRERIIPIGELYGIERTTLEEIKAIDPLFSADAWDIRRVLFLDTETTGLNGGTGTVAFEIGIGFIDRRGLVIRQYVMRDYSEEAAMLSELAAIFSQYDTFVTFNGKSFDLPLIESRMVMCRIRMPVTQKPHLDILHAARRVYKLRLKRCNLAVLEENVLGVQRDDDLPGSQVPVRYFDYLKTGEFALLDDVLRHNFDDIKSLASLTGHLCAVFRAPEMLEFAEDAMGVGRTLIRSGNIRKAQECFRIASRGNTAVQACMYLAQSYKKEKEWLDVVSTCQSMIACGRGGIWPYIELAKYYEHIDKDPARALSYSNGALIHMLNMAPVHGYDEEQVGQIRRRIERLKRKQKRKVNKNIQEA